ncbi:MAG: EMC3/TMCO1 family protein [Candidatus Pacearchaeota archaeon]
MEKSGKEGSFTLIFIVLFISIAIASLWDVFPFIKNLVHYMLDPLIGRLLDWNILWGMTILIFIVNIFMTLIQKYATDQKKIKELKNEQKKISEEAKKFRDNPQKMMEINRKSLEFMPLMFKHSMRPMIYTGIPLILLFRWFIDYFSSSSLEGFKFFGFFSWFWYYLIVSIIFSMILRKIMDVH